MYWDITAAEHVDAYRIRVCFRDGKSGIVDLQSRIELGGVFSAIADVEAFRQFTIDSDWHVLSWQGGRIDLAPETVYAEATGEEPLRHVAETRGPYASP